MTDRNLSSPKDRTEWIKLSRYGPRLVFSLQIAGAVLVSFTLKKSSDSVDYLPIKPGRYHQDGKGYTDKFVEKT